jgi:UDPglucose 6-dehydrogenase
MISMGEKDVDMALLRAVERVNEKQKRLLVDKVKAIFGAKLTGMTFAVWGLAFKPRTDDMREAPAITVINALLKAGAKVRAFDPEAMQEAKRRFGERISYAENNYEALNGAAGLLILTEWNEFRRPDFARMKQLLKNPMIFDGRNIYDPADLKKLGFKYFPIGRKHG